MRHIKFDFPVKEKIYKLVGERKLKLYIFEPKKPTEYHPAILFFIGGSFKKGPKTPADFQNQAKYFSEIGMVGICVDYRTGYDPDFTPIQAICDVKSAVRWVRENAESLGVDANKVVVCGSSAGGYIAVSSIMFEELHDESDHIEINPNPNALVIFGAGMDGVDIMRRRYPELLDRAITMSPLHNVKKCLPPTLWMIGTDDDLIDQNKLFVNQMVEVGNDILFETYEGMEHGFFLYGRHGNKSFQETNQRIEEYLRSKNFL